MIFFFQGSCPTSRGEIEGGFFFFFFFWPTFLLHMRKQGFLLIFSRIVPLKEGGADFIEFSIQSITYGTPESEAKRNYWSRTKKSCTQILIRQDDRIVPKSLILQQDGFLPVDIHTIWLDGGFYIFSSTTSNDGPCRQAKCSGVHLSSPFPRLAHGLCASKNEITSFEAGW